MSGNAYLFGDPVKPREELPEARRSHHRPTICGPCGIMAEVFCVNCGKAGGLITEDWAEHVFYLCDKCAEKWGKLPDVVEIPEAVVRGEGDFV